ncbi:peptidyl-prolyl cis-trans isomerase B (cyclophilin B) [Aurantimicrobium minutum]|uniref:peptidylprolyl isomerase n=1 Tax=Aurantimicrobium minutum TaxID=708131 RepID=UPI002476FA73|nr:peptidylprolyl isomerase [Aurantimicrobium minutum]MDH6533006.1 peptidyl-prolyl cis-trans isomerase B (cyclophilin B) [Aurantimicrobium minutum]
MAKTNDNRVSKEARDRISSYEARKAEFERNRKLKKRRNGIIVGSVSGVFALAIGIGVTAAVVTAVNPAPVPVPTATGVDQTAPDPSLSENRIWTGSMNIGGVPVGFELDGAAAPQAVASTVSLITYGFYEGISCHRLTTEGIYVLQCGDPNGDGSGGPGYSYGPIENAPVDDFYPAGTIAMARQGGNGESMGSQFFIVYEDSIIPSDEAGGYTVIGHITSGLPQLITDITSKGTATGGPDGAPAVPVTMTAVTVQ